MQQEPVKRLPVHRQCFVKRKIMPGFHVQVERKLSDACSLNYKRTPLSSTKTNTYICIYACMCIYILILWSRKALHESKQPSWRLTGPSGAAGSPRHRARKMQRWAARRWVPPARGGRRGRSSRAWVKSLSGYFTRQSPHLRAFLKPGKSSDTHTCQSGGSCQWGRGNR